MTLLTQDRLKELLHYEPVIGLFWWKWRSPITPGDKSFNTKFAGRIAGTRNDQGYGVIFIDGKPYKAHRLAWLYTQGVWPEDELDHINRFRLNNAMDNLREATRSQNNTNSVKPNITGFKGVTPARSGRFVAQIGRTGRPNYIGTFDTPEEANAAYEAEAKKQYGEYARSK